MTRTQLDEALSGVTDQMEGREWNPLLLCAKSFESTSGILNSALLIGEAVCRKPQRMSLINGRLTSSPSSMPLLFVQEGILRRPFRHSVTGAKARKDKRGRFVIGGEPRRSLPNERSVERQRDVLIRQTSSFASFGYLADLFPRSAWLRDRRANGDLAWNTWWSTGTSLATLYFSRIITSFSKRCWRYLRRLENFLCNV